MIAIKRAVETLMQHSQKRMIEEIRRGEEIFHEDKFRALSVYDRGFVSIQRGLDERNELSIQTIRGRRGT